MKLYLCLLASFLMIQTKAQEVVLPLGSNVWLNNNADKSVATNSTKQLGKAATLTIPFTEYFNARNYYKPDTLKWMDSNVTVANLNAVFNNTDKNGVIYNTGFSEADVLTSRLINTTDAGNAFIYINYSTGIDWVTNDSLILQIKGSNDVWKTIWKAANDSVTNRDVFVNFSFVNEFASNNIQCRFINYCQTTTAITEDFRINKFVISYKNILPFYQSFRSFTPLTSTPLNTNWIGFSNQVTINDSVKMIWGNSVIFNSITQFKDSSYNGNSGAYGCADTLMLNPVDLSTASASDQLVLSFWVRSFKEARNNDSLYLETLDNLGRWQRAWAISKIDTLYQKVSIPLTGRLRHSAFTFRLINKGTYTLNDTQSFALAALKITAKQNLPLVEDFSSTKGFYPDPEKWIDKEVFINNNFPKNQPSLNVATFDGLDENGNAYSKLPLKGIADKLTSKGYNLSAFAEKDSIYLSFYYQYQLQGTTQQIYPDDSLILEFRSTPNDADSFDIIWQKSALDTLGYDTFYRVMIQVPVAYLHDDFQFRFKNRGSLTGNLSHWHVDYIKLDNGRSRNDTSNYDLAISSTPTSILRKYRSMPWSHFTLNKAKYTNDTVYFSVFNNDKRNFLVDYRRQLYDNEQSLVFTNNKAAGSIPYQVSSNLESDNATTLNSSSTGLVKTFRSKVAVSDNNFANNDNIPTNDSISVNTKFSNYFAYDDGTAEGGYGIYLKTNASVALAYDLEKPDTIYGVEIFFNQSAQDVSTRSFDLMVWEDISPVNQTADKDKVIYRKNGLKPIYNNAINGFASILFDSAIVVGKRFFVGWEQIGQFVLNIGLDENYYMGRQLYANPNMFYKTDGFWKPTEIPGALMIRPLLGQVRDFPVSVPETPQPKAGLDYVVYPNPTTGTFTIETLYKGRLTVRVFDLMGKEIIQTNMNNGLQTINLPGLTSGMYLVQLLDERNGTKLTKKLLIE